MASNQRVYQDHSFRLTSHRNVMFAVWNEAPTLPQVRTLHREGETFARHNPGGQALVDVVAGGVPTFTESVRDEVVKVMKSPGLFTLGTAHLILVPGMTGSAVRAFLSTATLLARPASPHRVFATIAEAISWIHGRLGGLSAQWTSNELRDALEEAKRER